MPHVAAKQVKAARKLMIRSFRVMPPSRSFRPRAPSATPRTSQVGLGQPYRSSCSGHASAGLLFEGDDPSLNPHQPVGHGLIVAARKPGADQVTCDAGDACRQGVGTFVELFNLACASRIET